MHNVYLLINTLILLYWMLSVQRFVSYLVWMFGFVCKFQSNLKEKSMPINPHGYNLINLHIVQLNKYGSNSKQLYVHLVPKNVCQKNKLNNYLFRNDLSESIVYIRSTVRA